MAYTDYQFYTTKYFGDAVTEEEFSKYAERASERLDRITFGRLEDGLPEDKKSNAKVQIVKLYEPAKKEAGIKIQEETPEDSAMKAVAMMADAKVF